MRQIVLFLVFLGPFLLVYLSASSQHSKPCGTALPESYISESRRAMPGYFGCEQINKVNRRFSVLFHVIKDSLGGTGVSDANLQESLDQLNFFWTPTGMSFEFCERRDQDNHQFNIFDQAEHEADMIAMYYEPNIINVFITSSIETEDYGEVGGYAYLPGGIDFIIVTKSSMQGPGFGTLIHEMGHFFGLLHTFESDTGQELVDGSNCATAGDLVCDTEANPTDDGEDFELDTDCNYIGQPAIDANGDFYVPPGKNFMSYSPCKCEFTTQQYNRMVEQYLQFRNYLW